MSADLDRREVNQKVRRLLPPLSLVTLLVAHAAAQAPAREPRVTLSGPSSPALAQQSATVTQAAPIYVAAQVSSTPLRTAAVGTKLKVVQDAGEGLQVQFNDPQFGLRTGWIQRRLVTLSDEALAPMDLSVPAAPVSPGAPPPSQRALSSTAYETTREFSDGKLTVADGDKTKEVDVTVRFGNGKMQLVNGNGEQRVSLKDLPYADCKSAEYSYSKSPRWKSGLFISPFLFLSSGKRHWFMVKTTNDYALMHLDKGNYKLILAEFEARTGVKVEAEGENK